MSRINYRANFTKKEREERKVEALCELSAIFRADCLEASRPEAFTTRDTSASWMTHRIRVYVAVPTIEGSSTIRDITYHCADLLDLPYNDDGILRNGCGMDFAYDTIHSVSCELFNGKDRAGYVIKQRCL